MKRIVLASLLGALSLTAAAQTASTSDTVTIKANEQKIERHDATLPMSTDEFDQFTGSYALSNGDTLVLFSNGLKKYAVLHDGIRHEIMATSPNSFVALHTQLKMKLDHNDGGDMNVELTMPAPAGQLASGATQVVTLALH